MLALQVCGSTKEPASIGRNPLAYTVLLNNLGCTPAVPAADIDPWLDPVRRPAALRDRPRHELIGADPDECRRRLLETLEAERHRLGLLAVRVREEVDLPSLREALNRVSILTEASARRAARSHTEARVTFHQASNDLVKTLARDEENGVGPVAAENGVVAGAPTEADIPEQPAREIAPGRAGPEGEEAGPAGVDCPLPTTTDAGRLPARRHEDKVFHAEPEDGVGHMTQVEDTSVTSVDARVHGSGCTKMRTTGAQTDPPPAQTGANAAAGVTDQALGSDEPERDQGPGTKDQGAEASPAGAADVEQSLPTAPDAGPLPADRREDGFSATKPEKAIDVLIQNPDETITYVDARVPGSGCAIMRTTGAQTDPPPAQTDAKEPEASLVWPSLPGSSGFPPPLSLRNDPPKGVLSP